MHILRPCPRPNGPETLGLGLGFWVLKSPPADSESPSKLENHSILEIISPKGLPYSLPLEVNIILDAVLKLAYHLPSQHMKSDSARIFNWPLGTHTLRPKTLQSVNF